MTPKLPDPDKKLKMLAKAMIAEAGGSETAALDPEVRVGSTMLGNYGNLNHPNFMPIDVLIALTRETGMPDLLREVARRCGYSIQKISAVDPGCAVRIVAGVSQEMNEAWQALSEGTADGVFCADDRARLQGELLDVSRKAAEGAAALGVECAP